MILTVYNEQICREILLPHIFDADYTISLYKEIYHLRDDLRLRLENSAAGWTLTSGDTYRILSGTAEEERHLIKDGDILEIHTRYGERLALIAADIPISFRVMEKYDLSNVYEITIGRNTSNTVSYEFMTLVSAFHAVLRRDGGGWVLEDRSKNGVFCSHLRIQGGRRLSFGDQIDIFGLHMVFMGDVLLVGSNGGKLTVDTGALPLLQIEPVRAENAEFTDRREKAFFNRSPRNLPVLCEDPIEIEAPPAPKAQKNKPAYLVIGPAFTMAIPMFLGCLMMIYAAQSSGRSMGAYMYTGLVTAVGSAIIGAIWAVLNMKYGKQEDVREEQLRFNAYSNYLVRIAQTIREEYIHNASALNQIYPAAAELAGYNRYTPELWNRNSSHEDFLYERLGIGDLPFQAEISVPKEKFTLLDDSLAGRPRSIREEFETLHNVPVGMDLMSNHLIGLVGGEGKHGAIDTMRVLAADIAASVSYTDVKMVFIYNEEDRVHLADWECMRWFPHVWSEDKRSRYMAANEMEIREIFFLLAGVFRTRAEEAGKNVLKRGGVPRPYYVLFLSDPGVLQDEMVAKYILSSPEDCGVTTFLMVESVEQLPNECEVVLENDMNFKGMYNLRGGKDAFRKAYLPDSISAPELEAFGKELANIEVREVEATSEIPASLSFFDLYNVRSLKELNVTDRWRKNRNYQSMKVPVGRKAGGHDCYLDIHEKFHGPHGLVAGTTGSGKSETLQTYILSLAVNFSPEDVSFFIIDFKGGGMANLFSGLPHLAGQISNLSGNQVRRAMISIKSENMRRQRIFAENGVNNINLYTQLYKNHEAKVPVPHLFIIIDEFAELKREEPEFMQELISVAQVGRSLGVHLILATQKPSGTVDDNIWSNSKFRLCLRVQDRQDSMDMLHKPDAAFLTQAGRCYLQVGNDEIYELFQSGYSGAVYTENYTPEQSIAMIGRTGKADIVSGKKKKGGEKSSKVVEKTQLDAVIEYLAALAAQNGYGQSAQLWLPVLTDHLLLDSVTEDPVYTDGTWPSHRGKWSLSAAVGLYDDPEKQAQNPLIVDFSTGGHLAVCGGVVSGKSTFLSTLVYAFMQKYSPDMLQMYLLDFSAHMLSAFADAPHVGGIVTDNQEDRLDKFFHMLGVMMEERRKQLAGGNYSQYVQAYGVRIPAIFVVIDNYASFREKSGDKYEDILLRLAREGVGFGIFLVISSSGFGLSEIPSRMGDQIRTVISLEMQDKFKYMDVMHVTRLSIFPETGVKGRGLARVGDRVLEFQTALPLEAQDDFDRGQKIAKICRNMRTAWKGASARPIPEIPAKPTLGLLLENREYLSYAKNSIYLPIGYNMEDASLHLIDPAKNYCFAVTGRSRTGKTNVLRLLLCAGRCKGAKIVIIEKEADFRELAGLPYADTAEVIGTSKQMYDYFAALLPEFVRRNKKKQEYIKAGLEEEVIAEKMREEELILIFIADMKDFMTMVYKPEEGVGGMSGFVENIMEKGRLHNIAFFAQVSSEDIPMLTGYRAYHSFSALKRGVHLGGNLSGQKYFNFQNIPYGKQNKTQKKGFGYISDEEEEMSGREIVIPNARLEIDTEE